MTDKDDELLKVHEVALRLRVHDTTVRRWIQIGALEAVTLPHRGKRKAYRIKRSKVNELIEPERSEQREPTTTIHFREP